MNWARGSGAREEREASIAFGACFMVFDCESMMRWGRQKSVPQTGVVESA